VVARTQVLTDDVFQRIRPGIRAAEVLELIGPPSAKTRFDNLRATSWEYHYHDGWGYIADLSVMVDDSGVVTSKSAAREGD
jgi:outer membrane protein assembly factor BamE (lipoprotein component of BamABCDE complex)